MDHKESLSLTEKSMDKDSEEFFNVRELAKFLNIKESQVRNLNTKKQLPVYRVGSLLRYSKKEILKYLEDNKKIQGEVNK